MDKCELQGLISQVLVQEKPRKAFTHNNVPKNCLEVNSRNYILHNICFDECKVDKKRCPTHNICFDECNEFDCNKEAHKDNFFDNFDPIKQLKRAHPHHEEPPRPCKQQSKEYINKLINKEVSLDFYGRLNRIRKNINTENYCNKNTYFENKTDTRIISITGCCVNNEHPHC